MAKRSNMRTSYRSLSGLLLSLIVVLTACNGNNGGNGSNSATSGPQAATDAIHVKFVYGSEKKAWVDDVTKTFNAGQTKTASGKPIFVDTEPIGSGDSMTNILNGSSQPTLWSPASAIWLPLLNDGWSKANGKDLIDVNTCKNLVVSPVVVMMWKRMAGVLGWPTKAISWLDIANLSTTPGGWADAPYNTPQLGKFRFGHTHPDYSNSGFETILAMAYAATKPDRALTLADVQKPETATFINKLESAISHYGASTGSFGDTMIQRGPTYLSAAVVYESVVVSSYGADGKPKNLDDSLVAIYPSEGTFLSDHPACIPINASWITPDQKDAAGIYRDYLLNKASQTAALQYGFRPADPSIALSAPIDAAHGVDPSQPKNALTVPDAATIRAVRDLWQTQKRKVNLTLVMDVSGSMADAGKMAGAREGGKAFVDQLDDSATLTLIIFDDHIKTVFDTLLVGANRDKIKSQIDLLSPGGGTALRDAVGFAAKCLAGQTQAQIGITEVDSSPKCGKPDGSRINAVVVMTDGQDTNSTFYSSTSQLMSDIGRTNEKAADITIYTIGYGKDADESALAPIAKGAGGEYRKAPTSQDIQTVYRDISTFF